MEPMVSDTNFTYRIAAFGERNFGGRFRMGLHYATQQIFSVEAIDIW